MTPYRPKASAKLEAHRGALHPTAVVGTPDHHDQRKPNFSFEHADREYDGAWSWPVGPDAEAMLRFLCEVNQLTWADIHAAKYPGGGLRHHEQMIDTVSVEAQARITDLGHDERFESLYRFGVTKNKRLWGFATEGTFYVLWWDARHAVYPLGAH